MNMTIYLVKKWTGINNTEIGDLFGGLSYSAVSKINTRFSDTLKTDEKLRRGVREIMEHLSHVKACPQPHGPLVTLTQRCHIRVIAAP